jgi:hypothetical protein
LFRLSYSRLCRYKLFRNPPAILKIVPKASYECSLKKLTIESKGKPEQKFDAAFGKLSELVSVFKEAIKNFTLIFSRTKQAKKCITLCACQKSTDLIL